MYVCVCVCVRLSDVPGSTLCRTSSLCVHVFMYMYAHVYICVSMCAQPLCWGHELQSRGHASTFYFSSNSSFRQEILPFLFSCLCSCIFSLCLIWYAFFNALLAVLFFPLMSFFVTGVRSRCTDLWKWWGGVRSQDSATWQHSFGIYMCVHTYSHWCTDTYGCICIHWHTLRLDNAALVWGGYDS